MQGRHSLQHRPVRFLHPLKNTEFVPSDSSRGVEQNKFRDFRLASCARSSDARSHRLCLGHTFRPVKRTYSTKITCLGVPSQQPFASSHIKPLYYNRFFPKKQDFSFVKNTELSKQQTIVYCHNAQKRRFFRGSKAQKASVSVKHPNFFVQITKSPTTRFRVISFCQKSERAIALVESLLI